MNFKNLTSAIVLGMALAYTPNLFAQNLQSVTHGNIHDDLLASQPTIQQQIHLEETAEYIDLNFKEEEEPELDLYTECWDSQSVNPYKEADVPETAVLNVANYCMPHNGYITSPYGYRRRFRRMHKGVDIKLQIGDTVRAAFDGKIRLTRYERRGYGYYVIIRHDNGMETVYGHLSRFLVKPDTFVKAGDPIALGGNTGRSTGSHLHFETRYMGYPINPSAIFDFDNQTTHTDQYTFDKKTYKIGRDYSPNAQRQRYEASRNDKNNRYRGTKKDAIAGAKAGGIVYYVRSGDSLGKIARRYGTTINKLCRTNHITRNTTLQIGRRLWIE